MERYFVDIRGGCGAVRDRLHNSYDESYQGLNNELEDVVEYRHGYSINNEWFMKEEDISYLNNLCIELNKNNQTMEIIYDHEIDANTNTISPKNPFIVPSKNNKMYDEILADYLKFDIEKEKIEIYGSVMPNGDLIKKDVLKYRDKDIRNFYLLNGKAVILSPKNK